MISKKGDLYDNIHSIIDRVGISPQMIEFEVTESFFLDFDDNNKKIIPQTS